MTDFLIVTALEEERDAVLRHLPGHAPIAGPGDVRVYYAASVRVDGGSEAANRSVVVVTLLNMGRVQAALATADAIRRWEPRFVLMVGIAGGIRQKGVNLGDVLVADQVADYEEQKIDATGAHVRWRGYQCDARLLSTARNLGTGWIENVAMSRPQVGGPKRVIGSIASGDKVQATQHSMDFYRDKWASLIGVEMEGGGVAPACEQSTSRPGFGMIRGVSDLADEEKGTTEVEKWRAYACEVAATYATSLIQSHLLSIDPGGDRSASTGAAQSESQQSGTGVVRASGPWVLLEHRFFRAESVSTRHDHSITCTVRSESAEEDAFFRGLKLRVPIPFAYRNDGLVVRLVSLESEGQGSAEVWSIQLKPETLEYGGSSSEFSYSDGKRSYSVEELATMKARQILLNENAGDGIPSGRVDTTLQAVLRTGSYCSIETAPLRTLYKEFGRNEDYLCRARLAAIFVLKASGVVEHVTDLTLSFDEDNVRVSFKGIRRRKYTNVPPATIQVDGSCYVGL